MTSGCSTKRVVTVSNATCALPSTGSSRLLPWATKTRNAIWRTVFLKVTACRETRTWPWIGTESPRPRAMSQRAGSSAPCSWPAHQDTLETGPQNILQKQDTAACNTRTKENHPSPPPTSTWWTPLVAAATRLRTMHESLRQTPEKHNSSRKRPLRPSCCQDSTPQLESKCGNMQLRKATTRRRNTSRSSLRGFLAPHGAGSSPEVSEE
mmetsp:Transcript_24167/g.70922  ORF Transcript_24167/g.70922 Transcript_24167/m.70922 type:complete len:209 (+) Transcript_24167:92-718(+)